MDKREAYRDLAKAQIKEWEAKIDLLKARGEKATAGAKIDMINAVEKLQAEKNALQKRIAEMMDAGGDAWEKLKDGMEKAMDEMKKSIEKTMEKFK
jgi:phage-related minor tail protein